MLNLFLCLGLSVLIPDLTGDTLTISGSGIVTSDYISGFTPSSLRTIIIKNDISEIDRKAFSLCEQLTSIQLPESLKIIRSWAFSYTKLTELHIPDNVEIIETDYLIYTVSDLKNITVSEKNTFFSDFKGCLYNNNYTELLLVPNAKKDIELNENLVTLKSWSMFGIQAKSIRIPDNVKSLEGHTIVDSTKLELLIFTENSLLSEIPDNCFWQCGMLNFTCPPKVQKIGMQAFMGCSLRWFKCMPNSVLTTVMPIAFYNNDRLHSIELPYSLETIEDSSFSGCTSLTNLTILSPHFPNDNGVIYNSQRTIIFSIDLTLETITISSTVKSIMQGLLQRCENLTEVNFDGVSSHFIFHDGVLYSKSDGSALLACGGKSRIVFLENTTMLSSSICTGMKKLKSVSFEENCICRNIARNAFYKLDCLEEITFSDGIEIIGDSCFLECTKLKKILLPKNIASIEDFAFIKCYSLQSFECPAGCALKNIGQTCLLECLNLTNVVLSDGINHINEYAFSCTPIKEIRLPSSLKILGVKAFQNCTELTSVIFPEEIPLEVLSDRTFSNCKKLDNIKIPKAIRTLGASCFGKCYSLKHFDFFQGTNLQNITGDAFTECNSLINFTLPISLKSISPTAFSYCTNILNIFSETTIYKSLSGILYDSNGTTLVLFPPGRQSSNISEDTMKIGPQAFYGCINLQKLEFKTPSQLHTLARNSFDKCTRLANLTIPDSVSEIEAEAFRSCESLSTVVFAKSSKLTKISRITFSNCTSLTTIRFEEGSNLQTIDESAFEEAALITINIPPMVRSIGAAAFKNCKRLKDVEFDVTEAQKLIKSSNQLKIVCEETFRGCIELNSIQIPSTVTDIKRNAFDGCIKLIDFDFPIDLQTIEANAFRACDLRKIGLKDNVTTIKIDSFSELRNLQLLNLSLNLNILEVDSFRGCPKLETIFYCGSNQFQENAFPSHSLSLVIYTKNTYTFSRLCGIPVLPIMKSCGYLPTAIFTKAAGDQSIQIASSIIAPIVGGSDVD